MKKYLLCLIFLHATLFALSITSGPTTLSSGGNNTNPQIVLSSGGTAMAIWTNSNQISASFYDGSSWTLYNNYFSGNFPKIGIDASGNAILIWLTVGFSASSNQIYYARFTASLKTWSSAIQLSSGGINASPQIAVNSSGNALAVWYNSTSQEILARSYNASTGVWSSSLSLVSGTSSFPQVSIDDLNKGIVVWLTPSFSVQAENVSIP